MEPKTFPRFLTAFEGVRIEVTDAQISECPQCGEKLYDAKEIKRWKQIKEAVLATRGRIPLEPRRRHDKQ